jgi:hypothetical protein
MKVSTRRITDEVPAVAGIGQQLTEFVSLIVHLWVRVVIAKVGPDDVNLVGIYNCNRWRRCGGNAVVGKACVRSPAIRISAIRVKLIENLTLAIPAILPGDMDIRPRNCY